jgi:hypothetical protein
MGECGYVPPQSHTRPFGLNRATTCTLQAEASLRVPLRIICIPFFNWIYAKGSERSP